MPGWICRAEVGALNQTRASLPVPSSIVASNRGRGAAGDVVDGDDLAAGRLDLLGRRAGEIGSSDDSNW